MFLKKTAEPFCVAFIRSLALMWPNICVNFGGKSAKSSLHLSFHNQKSIGNKYTVSLLLFYKLGDNWLYLMGESTPGSRLLLDTQLPSYLATFAYKMDSCISTFLEANLEWKNSQSIFPTCIKLSYKHGAKLFSLLLWRELWWALHWEDGRTVSHLETLEDSQHNLLQSFFLITTGMERWMANISPPHKTASKVQILTL